MPATNYNKPSEGDYQLVRIKGKQAEILDPDTLGKILSILELHEEGEVSTDRPLWDALYRSQPFHSAQVDPSGSHWRIGRFLDAVHAAYEIPRMFLWAVRQGHVPPEPRQRCPPHCGSPGAYPGNQSNPVAFQSHDIPRRSPQRPNLGPRHPH